MSSHTEPAAGTVLLITSEQFTSHAPPSGHPERVERADVMSAAAKVWADGGGQVVAPIKASTDALLQVHASEYIEAVAATSGRSVRLGPDTYTSSDSEDVARYAAGAAIMAVDYVIEVGRRAMAFVRPPGHHAERNRAMGFCLYNNIAVAAVHARTRGLARVAIVDYDVHHGNGTQWLFYDDPTVLFISLHQSPFYPWTGAADDVGSGDGAGFTVNVPLEEGAVDADYLRVFDDVVLPVLERYDPELVLLSAGFDAHVRDPLGGMQVSTDGYAEMTSRLCGFTDRCCAGRLMGVTEGGYDLRALEECLRSTLRVLADPLVDSAVPGYAATRRADVSLDAVRRAQAQFWPGL